jgi:hypothetical protein
LPHGWGILYLLALVVGAGVGGYRLGRKFAPGKRLIHVLCACGLGLAAPVLISAVVVVWSLIQATD